jgi:cell division septation protein DedD
MKRKGKIITVSSIILLFFIIVLLGAVDLGKFIDHPKVIRKNDVLLNADIEARKELGEKWLHDKPLKMEKSEDREKPSSNHDSYEERKKNNQPEHETEKKIDTVLLKSEDSNENKKNGPAEAFSEEKDNIKRKPEINQQVLTYPYSVLISTFRTFENAKKAIGIYKKKGLLTYWVKVDLGDRGIWYRVFTGFFMDGKSAELFIKTKHIAGARAKRTKYAVLVGKYSSDKEIEAQKDRFTKLGYSPYIINKNKERLLYVGAFFTEEGAIEQRSELISSGIQCQVAER